MESHPYEKSGGGEGEPSSNTLSSDPAPPEPEPPVPEASLEVEQGSNECKDDEAGLCRHIDARGHRCRMLVMSIEADFCAYHAQRHLQTQHGREIAAAELLGCVSDFSEAASVNRFLGNLVKQVTLKRIPRRDAITLAYICQLLLNSLGAINRQESLRLEESRVQALNAAKLPPKIIWDIPGPPYEGDKPAETIFHPKGKKDPYGRP
jgi:hypothetical protein